MHFAPGTRLLYRGLAWDVIGAEASGEQTRVRLRCARGDLAGYEWDALHPWDTLEPLGNELRADQPSSLDHWWLHQVVHLRMRDPGASAPASPHPGRVTLEPWQLVPLVRALAMPRPRLLLADGVGLGKTIQAGMIAAELIQRRRAHRIIIVTPPGPLLAQWDRELRARFGLRPVVLADAAALRAERQRRELGGNPFDGPALCLTSIDFAKRDDVLAEMERSAWDLAIIDEAHHCFADDTAPTRRRRLAEVLAARADGLLLLTATPHDGQDGHFASLMALLEPNLVDGNGRLFGQAYRRHVVRRLKSHIRDSATGAPAFRTRIIRPLPVAIDGPDDEAVRAFHRALADLISVRLTGSRKKAERDVLAFVGLLKRSVSTIAASIATLRVVAERYAELDRADDAARRRALRAYRRRTMRYGALSAAEEAEQALLEAEGIAASLPPPDDPAGANPVEALRAIIGLGQLALDRDPKLAALVATIRAIRDQAADANILVYTEYADSLDAARDALSADPALGTVLSISGADAEDRRIAAADRFTAEDRLILVSTDSMAEGLNLQRRCHHLVHLDLPYNPNRLEQRNGRIDRYGQTHDPDIRYLYLAGTFEERVLLRLIAKYERARADLEAMPNTLGVTADDAALAVGLVQGFAEDQAPLFPRPTSAIRTLDIVAEDDDSPAWRDLVAEISRAYAGFEGLALRHGWWEGAGRPPQPPDVPPPLPNVTPVSFLARAVTRAGGTVETDALTGDLACALPADWRVDLAGLPGWDDAAHRLRVTADPDRTRDAAGRDLACPGWPHMLLRHAADRFGAVPDTGPDTRVAVARGPRGSAAALLTFAAEVRSRADVIWRAVVAIRVAPDRDPAVVDDPSHWLNLPLRAAESTHVRHFAAWLPTRMAQAAEIATRHAAERAASALAERAAMLAADALALERWLARRALELCGSPRPGIDDLFGHVADEPAWKAPTAPENRLAALVRDPAIPPKTREDADLTLALWRDRTRRHADHLATGSLELVPIGLLMLSPGRS